MIHHMSHFEKITHFTRTECACSQCTIFCFSMPGMLIPSDLDKLIPSGVDDFAWAEEFLLASPGALVANRDDMKNPFRIPTLVFKTKPNQSCIFLTEDAKCGIHEKAPFGCAYLDSHMSKPLSDVRVAVALEFVMHDVNTNGRYFQIWKHLKSKNLVPKDVAHRRRDIHL